MELKFGDRVFKAPDTCPSHSPSKRTLRRNIQEHGVESFLTSRKLSQFAGCVADELVQAGAEMVEPDSPLASQESAPQAPGMPVDSQEPAEAGISTNERDDG